MEDPVPILQNSIPGTTLLQTGNYSSSVITALIIVVFLFLISALISGSENAFLMLSQNDFDKIRNRKSRLVKLVEKLRKRPEKLQAAILVSKTFIIVGIVIISMFIISDLFNISHNKTLAFLIVTIVITFLVLVIVEILPRRYSRKNALTIALISAPFLVLLNKLFSPLNSLIYKSTGTFARKSGRGKGSFSMNELSDALELTEVSLSDEKNILQGIVKFTNIYVSEIMQSRLDVLAIDINTSFPELLKIVNESGYSRIPVYKGTFDNISGILYIKDLLPHLGKPTNYKWQSLIRPSYFVPESKKINDLLKEFQSRHIHMAIVVDEYGGTSGIVTLEDILEEIVGEISDESDEDILPYKIIDKDNIIFEGKVLLNDFYKIFEIKDDLFDDVKGEADTLAGLILELKGEIPKPKDKLNCKDFIFEILEVDKRRIKLVHVSKNRKSE